MYLDNGATTYPKPCTVIDSMSGFLKDIGCSPGRGGYSKALDADRIVYNARKQICELFNGPGIENVIFTQNITSSLNMVLKGMFQEGWHIITTSMEHNSVMRPLSSLKAERGIEVTVVDCNKYGMLDANDIEKSIKHNTRAIVMTHASNLTGTIMPAEEVGQICRKHNLIFILDTAQSAGVLDLDFEKLNLDVLAFTGHKGLLGPQGTGGFIISKRAAEMTKPFIEGGTGSKSHEDTQPLILPDKYESGTLNAVGIAGLKAAVEYIKSEGIKNIREHELRLCRKLTEGFLSMEGCILYGPHDPELKTGIAAMNIKGTDPSELAYILDSQYGIMVRSGMHCAPHAHRTVGSYPQGSVRFSIGYFNTDEDMDYTLYAVKKIINEMK